MIEPIMFFGIGFLAAGLFGLVLIPLVHNTEGATRRGAFPPLRKRSTIEKPLSSRWRETVRSIRRPNFGSVASSRALRRSPFPGR